MVALAVGSTVGHFSGTRPLWQLVVGKFSSCPLCPAICPGPTGSPGPGAFSQLRTKTVWKDLSLSPLQSLEHLCSKQLSDRKTFVFLQNMKEGSWFLKFMNCVEWNVPLWVLERNREAVSLWHPSMGHLRQEKSSQTKYLAWYRPLFLPFQEKVVSCFHFSAHCTGFAWVHSGLEDLTEEIFNRQYFFPLF